jgi:ABC-type multidrug transport system ATPase subunit
MESTSTVYKTLFGTQFGADEGLSKGVEVKWTNLTVRVEKSDRVLLRNVTGSVGGGRLLAIIGSSGSGKTTFLNQLSQRARGVVQDGIVTFNSAVLKQDEIVELSGYCEQDDLLFGELTVEETLLFAARMR